MENNYCCSAERQVCGLKVTCTELLHRPYENAEPAGIVPSRSDFQWRMP